MRLSDINGERTFEVIADIIEPACNIAQDPVASSIFKGEKRPKGMTTEQFAMMRAKKYIPALLKGHKDDLVTIFATLEGVSKEEYLEGLTLAKLIGSVAEMLNDEELVAFFS